MKNSNSSVYHRPPIALEPWIIGISEEEMVAFSKKAGFDGIEYMLTLRDLAFGVDHILKASKAHSMPVISLHQPLLLCLQTPPMLLPHMLQVAQQFSDAKLINHHLSAFMLKKSSSKRALAYKNMFEKAGFAVSYESNPKHRKYAVPFAKPTYDPKAFQSFCREYGLPMNLDVCHIASANYDIVQFFSDNHEHIRLIHLSDFKDGKEHLPIREGSLPLKELLQEIRHKKWNGNITFEIFNFSGNRSKKEKFIALEKSLSFVHENLK